MSDVASIVDRIYRDWLQPPGEQPSRFEVDTGGIDAVATTLPVDTDLLAAEETDLIGAGTLIEVESELMLIEATDNPPTSLTVRRGMYGTTAAAHTAGTFIYLASDDYIPRHSIFTAVADAVETLWPDLWTVGVEETFAANFPVDIPSTSGEVLDVLNNQGSRWRRTGTWEEFQDFPLSETGNAVQLSGMSGAIQIYYKRRATRPTAESDLLADLGVETGWVKVIVANAVAQLIANRDLNQATVDFITQSLEAEAGGPIGTGADIRNALLQFADFQTEPLKRQLDQKQHDRVYIDEQY